MTNEAQRQRDVAIGRELYELIQGSVGMIGADSKTMLLRYQEIGARARELVLNQP